MVGKSKFITKETFLKSIPRETPYSRSWCLRFLDTGEVGGAEVVGCWSSSLSEEVSEMVLDSSVARMIS